MLKITCVILTHNEEKNLKRALSSIKNLADEIIFLDEFSTDNTKKIASDFSAKIFENKNSTDFSMARNLGLQKAKNDWVLFLDADEEFVGEVGEIEAEDLKKISAFRIKRTDYLWGREIEHGESGSWKKARLIKKDGGEFAGKVHEEFEPTQNVVDLGKCFLRHYPHQTMGEYLHDINSYSSTRARELFEVGKQSNVLAIVAYPVGKFLYDYFILLGFLDGIRGFIIAALMSFYSFLVRAKLYILNRDKK
jgi:glycosyltransferase involved in cell wall biosynthesis